MKNAVGCAECAFLHDCGGETEQAPLFGWGCYLECMLKCNHETCDLTCPNNQHLFAQRLAEIGGTFSFASPALRVPTAKLTRYVTKIHNGSGRLQDLSVRMASVPIRELLCKSGASVSCRFRSAEQVRNFFRLAPQTAFIISCISVDEDVELVWEGLKFGGLAKEIARLKPSAIITPNFSFFVDDVPRIHTLYNRKRICLAAQILSDAGARVIIPLNALTSHDWDFWYELLRKNPDMKYVAKEFQTGLSQPYSAKEAIEDLSKLQERLNRPLHPVALGADRYRSILNNHFDKYTVIDSRPFMAAVKRRAMQTRTSSYAEIFTPTPPNEPIDRLLQMNVDHRLKRYR